MRTDSRETGGLSAVSPPAQRAGDTIACCLLPARRRPSPEGTARKALAVQGEGNAVCQGGACRSEISEPEGTAQVRDLSGDVTRATCQADPGVMP